MASKRIEISDGVTTDIFDLAAGQTIRDLCIDYASGYDHNGSDAPVAAEAQEIGEDDEPTGEIIRFIFSADDDDVTFHTAWDRIWNDARIRCSA